MVPFVVNERQRKELNFLHDDWLLIKNVADFDYHNKHSPQQLV